MKKNLFILFFYLLGLSHAFSQSIHENNQFIPPSPTVAELGKYGMIPVSYYTGVPDISIPLYTIECGSLKLPMSLSYHAGGIRVEQIASWVGLGWSLNAGGVISDNILGASDFASRINIKNFEDIELGQFPSQDELDFVTENDYDSQPDIFNYNFNGHTGQFILDNSLTPHEIRNNKQLQFIVNGGFTVRDDQGVIYEFKDAETTYTRYFQGAYLPASNHLEYMYNYKDKENQTAWFLTRIVSPNGQDTLKFTYEDEYQSYRTKKEGKIHYELYTERWTYEPSDVMTYLWIRNKTKRLSRIEGNNGLKIDFVANAIREDLEAYSTSIPTKRLDQIKIFFNNTLLKQWDMAYTYFQSSPTSTEICLNKRLRLSGITENQLKQWTFHYHGDNATEPQMPYRTAYCGSDYWGYYNGKITNVSDVSNPQKLFSQVAGTFTGTIMGTNPDYRQDKSVYFNYSQGSNKEPDSVYMKHG